MTELLACNDTVSDHDLSTPAFTLGSTVAVKVRGPQNEDAIHEPPGSKTLQLLKSEALFSLHLFQESQIGAFKFEFKMSETDEV
jgi:hypothetical protein